MNTRNCSCIVFCLCVTARGVRPSSALVRPGTDHLSSVTSARQPNGSVTAGRHPAAAATGVIDSVGGLRRAVLYVLGEKTQMKVTTVVILTEQGQSKTLQLHANIPYSLSLVSHSNCAPSGPSATAHFPFRWGQEAEFTFGHSLLKVSCKWQQDSKNNLKVMRPIL